MSTQLYVLVDQYKAMAERLSDLELDEQTIADTLEGLAGPLEDRAMGIAQYARNLEATADAIHEAEGQMHKRRVAIEKRAARIRAYVKEQMERAGISRIESPYCVVAIKRNPPALVIDMHSQIPARFMRQPDTPPAVADKIAITNAIKAGEAIGFAHLESSTRIAIE